MRRLLVLIVFWLAGASSAPGQQVYYDAKVQGKNIGEVLVNKKMSAGMTEYHISSKMEVDVLVNIKVDFDLVNRVNQRGHLIYAHAKNRVNGSENFETLISHKNGKLIFQPEGPGSNKKQQVLNLPQRYLTVAMLYFIEPKGFKDVFSEKYGKFLPLRAQKDGAYELTLPNGRTVVYHYQQGQCNRVDIELSLTKLVFIRRP